MLGLRGMCVCPGDPGVLRDPVQTGSIRGLRVPAVGSGCRLAHRSSVHHLDSSSSRSHTLGSARILRSGTGHTLRLAFQRVIGWSHLSQSLGLERFFNVFQKTSLMLTTAAFI